MSRSHLAPLDGVRVIASLSLIASHTLTIASALFPSGGPQWDALVSHPLFVFLSGGGGTHTDMFLVLGGLLVGLQHRAACAAAAAAPAKQPQSLLAETATGALRRAVRLWPTMLAQCALGFGILGDTVPSNRVPSVIFSTLFFFANYIRPQIGGSFTCSPAWSVAVAFHCGAGASFLLSLLRRAAAGRPRAGLAAARALFLALFLLSFAVRASLFDEKQYSLVRMSESRHFAYLQSGHGIAWVERTFPPFKWRVPDLDRSVYGVFAAPASPKAPYALRYLHRLYFPTHARFGPFALGVFLGLCLPEQRPQQQHQQQQQRRRAGPAWWVQRLLMGQFTLSAAGTLVSTMLPAPPNPDEAPAAAHAVSTIGLHNMTAMAIAWLLFTVLCPVDSPWHNAPLRRLLSWRELRPLAAHTFTINMIHFRIILELTFRLAQRTDPASLRCVPHVLGLYVCGTAVSYVVAVAFDEFVEPRLRGLIARGLSAGLGVVGVKRGWEDLAGVKKLAASPAGNNGAAASKKVT